jgi:hypothetical protein
MAVSHSHRRQMQMTDEVVVVKRKSVSLSLGGQLKTGQ